MNKLRRALLISALLLALAPARPAQAQVAVGTSTASGVLRFVTALNGLNLTLNASNITSGVAPAAYGGLGFAANSLTANCIVAGPAAASGAISCRVLVIADLPTSIPNANLANSSVTITPGSGISASGCAPLALGGTCTLTNTVSPTGPTLAAQTLWATPVTGEVGYLSANNTWSRASAAAVGTVNAQAVYMGTASTLSVAGSLSCLLVASLTLAPGDTLWLSDVTAGRFTNVKPSTGGNYAYALATLVDNTGYNSGAGSAQPCLFRPGFIQGL